MKKTYIKRIISICILLTVSTSLTACNITKEHAKSNVENKKISDVLPVDEITFKFKDSSGNIVEDINVEVYTHANEDTKHLERAELVGVSDSKGVAIWRSPISGKHKVEASLNGKTVTYNIDVREKDIKSIIELEWK